MDRNFINIAHERGFVQQISDEAGLSQALQGQNVCAYIGYDLTSDGLHVGSLVTLMLVRLWQKCGYRPIILLGGGTTKIGDPSDKDKMRPQLSNEQIDMHKRGIRADIGKLIDDQDQKTGAIFVDNQHVIMVMFES